MGCLDTGSSSDGRRVQRLAAATLAAVAEVAVMSFARVLPDLDLLSVTSGEERTSVTLSVDGMGEEIRFGQPLLVRGDRITSVY